MSDTDTDTNNTKVLGNTKFQNRSARSRHWCFTINNYSDKDIEFLKSLSKCKVTFQEETGNSGTKHLQGIISFENARTFVTMKNLLPSAHLEPTKNLVASIKYCSKSETKSGEHFSTHTIANKKGSYEEFYERNKHNILGHSKYSEAHGKLMNEIILGYNPTIDKL